MTGRLVHLLVLAALAVAPFGRIGAAQAMIGQAPMVMAAHCAGDPPPSGDRNHRMAVDCTIACAFMIVVPAPFALPPPALAAAPVSPLAAFPPGIRPEADPPPPRLA